MNNNIDFSPNKTRQNTNRDSFYYDKAILNTNLSIDDRISNRACNLSDRPKGLKINNVRARIVALVKALEYISID